MVNKYYQKHKEIYQNLSEEERDKKRQYAQERRRILSEEEKKKKRQYGREPYKTVIESKYKKHFSRMQEIKTIWV